MDSAVWTALAVFALPGLVLALVAGVRAPASFAAAVPTTFGLVGLSAWLLGVVGVRFTWLSFSITLVFFLLLAAAWRYAFAYRRRAKNSSSWPQALFPREHWRHGGSVHPWWVLPGAGVATGAWLCISRMMGFQEDQPYKWDNIVQGWDVQWHANAVRFVMETGVASSTRMGELQSPESHTALFYPSAFHAVTALFAQAAGLEPIPALNLASIVLPGLLVPAAAAALAWLILRGKGWTAWIASGLAPIAVYALPVVLWVSDYVGVRPYIVAVAMAFMVAAMFAAAPRDPALAFPLTFGFIGVLCAHPSAVTVLLLIVPLYWLNNTLIKPDVSRWKDTVLIAGPAVVGSLLFLPQVLAGSEQASEVQQWESLERFEPEEAWQLALMMETRHTGEFFAEFDPTILLCLGAFGLLAALVWRGQVWAGLFYFISLSTVVGALAPSILAKEQWGAWGQFVAAIANLHYSTAHRLVIPVALMVVACAAVAIAALIRLATLAPLAARYDTPAWRWTTAIAAIAVAVYVATGVHDWVTDTSDVGAKKAFAASRDDDRMVGDDTREAFDWLASRPEAYEGWTVGDPADGYSWLYAYAGVPTAARHFGAPGGGIGTDTSVVVNHGDLLGAGRVGAKYTPNPVDQAAKDQNIKFLIGSGHPFWFTQYPNWYVGKALWGAEGATPVYHNESVVVFAVNSQFSEEELREMQRDAQAHGSAPIPTLEPTTPPAGMVQLR